MYSVDISRLKRSEGGDAAFTEGDEGEQVVANVLLAAMVSQLYSEAAASPYIEYACALAKVLAQRAVTYRPSQLSKFARLSFEIDGKIEAFLVSVINASLVVPSFSSEKLKSDFLRTQSAIKFIDIELVRFTLRLRMRRIVATLEEARRTMSRAALCQAGEYMLAECLRHEVRSPEPFDRANDCFILAQDLVGKRNYPLAAFVLTSASSALDACSNSADCAATIQSMKGRIGQIVAEMNGLRSVL